MGHPFSVNSQLGSSHSRSQVNVAVPWGGIQRAHSEHPVFGDFRVGLGRLHRAR